MHIEEDDADREEGKKQESIVCIIQDVLQQQLKFRTFIRGSTRESMSFFQNFNRLETGKFSWKRGTNRILKKRILFSRWCLFNLFSFASVKLSFINKLQSKLYVKHDCKKEHWHGFYSSSWSQGRRSSKVLIHHLHRLVLCLMYTVHEGHRGLFFPRFQTNQCSHKKPLFSLCLLTWQVLLLFTETTNRGHDEWQQQLFLRNKRNINITRSMSAPSWLIQALEPQPMTAVAWQLSTILSSFLSNILFLVWVLLLHFLSL